MTTMVEYQHERRIELINGYAPATAIPTGGKGSRGNTAHLNLTQPPAPPPAPTKKMAHYHDRAANLVGKRAKRKAAEKARRPMSEYRKTVIAVRMRRKAFLTELASMDLTQTEIARLIGRTPATVCLWCRRFGIECIKFGVKDTHLEKIVREAYAHGGIGPTAMARKIGKSPKTLMVVASRIGVTGTTLDPYRFKRGYVVPPEKMADYRVLTGPKGRYSMREAGQMLGLLPTAGATP